MNTQAKKILKEVWEWVYTIAIAIAVAMLIKCFLFDIVRVDGLSMYPTLNHSDRLIVRKIGYKPEQGDIIILDAHYSKRESYYKQQAASQGKEKLNFIERLFTSVPDDLSKKYYVKRIIALPGQTVDIKNGRVYVDGEMLQEDYYDGITSPTDPSVSYPLTVEEDMVFVMGDNRGNSTDSRASSLGQVPFKAIKGKAIFRIFPFSSLGTVK